MNFETIFTREKLDVLFPHDRTDAFFDALFGGAEDGSYDISVDFVKGDAKEAQFAFVLRQRPGKCLACNLTYGLPQVFMRHPIINLKGFAESVAKEVQLDPAAIRYELGPTREHSREVHTIPIYIRFN
jgi:hypothetical protein